MSFDINKHEWSDITMNGYDVNKCANGSIILNGCSKSKVINKQDAIAIAKHFGLTADDIAQPSQSKEQEIAR